MIETLAFFLEPLAVTSVIALGCSLIGVYVVLRRMVFVGAALAQLSSAGVATSLFLGGAGVSLGVFTGPLFVALLFTLGGVAFFALGRGNGRIPSDTVLGAVFVVAGSASVLLVAGSATADIMELLFGGDVLLIGRADLFWSVAVVGLALVLHVLFYKEFVLVSYDPEMAAAIGFSVRPLNVLLFLTFGAVITVSMRSIGVLPVFGFLVLPGAAGLSLGGGMRTVFVWSALTGLMGTLVGFMASIALDLPTGPSIMAVLGSIALAAWLARKGLDGGRR